MRTILLALLLAACHDEVVDVAPPPAPVAVLHPRVATPPPALPEAPPIEAAIDEESDVEVIEVVAVADTDDHDSDSIPDSVDKCPDSPEDIDGFEDNDGCPDPDIDRDPVLPPDPEP